MKAKTNLDAVVGGVRIHVQAGEVLPQCLVDHWLVSNSMIRAIRQGLVEDDEVTEAVAPREKKPELTIAGNPLGTRSYKKKESAE